MRIKIFFIFMLSFLLCPLAFAENQILEMEQGKVYIMSFDGTIETILNDKKNLDAQILHTIFDDNKAVILTLTGNQESVFQVKTNVNLYNYTVKKSDKSSEELLEIDIPPIENINVDVIDGKN